MSHRAGLREAGVLLGAALRESEPWEEGYRLDMKSFRELLRREQELDGAVMGYLSSLATERVDRLVNWAEVRPQLQASTVPPISDQAWQDEVNELVVIVEPHIEAIAAVGVQAGEAIYRVPVDYSDLSDAVYKAAKTQTAEMVTQVTKTNRKLLQQAIEKSIRSGENVSGLIARIQKVVNNPVRAEMIAYTESVNAYQIGTRQFALETGAISKTWESKLGACPLCLPLDGLTIAIDELFTVGKCQVLHPTGHVRCRCGLRYNYPENA